MIRHTALLTFAALTLVTGCTASATVAPTPGSSTAPATTGAGATAGAGATVTTPGTGTATGAASDLFKVGRKWVYDIKNEGAGTTQTGTMTREIVSVTGTKAKVKTTLEITGAPKQADPTTVEVDTTPKDFVSSYVTEGGGTIVGSIVTTNESVTVPAGTYSAIKSVYKSTQKGVTTDSEAWTDNTVGLIKIVTKSTTDLAAQMPPGTSLPPGTASSIVVTSTITLKSVTP